MENFYPQFEVYLIQIVGTYLSSDTWIPKSLPLKLFSGFGYGKDNKVAIPNYENDKLLICLYFKIIWKSNVSKQFI